MSSDLLPAQPAGPGRRLSDGYRHVAVITRQTTILVARDPATLIAYAVMSAVLLLVLRPVYQRLGTHSGSVVIQETSGIAVMFTLLALDLAGQTLLSERTWSTWDRLRASPVGPLAIMVGKALPLIVVFFIQQAVLFGFAAGVFGFDLGRGGWELPVMALAWALCVTACGLALGVWVGTQGQLAATADIVAVLVTCLSGCLVPLAILPGWVRSVAPFTPGYWAQRGYMAAASGDTGTYLKAVGALCGVCLNARWLPSSRDPGASLRAQPDSLVPST